MARLRRRSGPPRPADLGAYHLVCSAGGRTLQRRAGLVGHLGNAHVSAIGLNRNRETPGSAKLLRNRSAVLGANRIVDHLQGKVQVRLEVCRGIIGKASVADSLVVYHAVRVTLDFLVYACPGRPVSFCIALPLLPLGIETRYLRLDGADHPVEELLSSLSVLDIGEYQLLPHKYPGRIVILSICQIIRLDIFCPLPFEALI